MIKFWSYKKEYKKHNPRIKKISAKKILGKNVKLNITMNLKKFKNLIND